jgi:hypothetical protein
MPKQRSGIDLCSGLSEVVSAFSNNAPVIDPDNSSSRHRNRAVVVAVALMRMMQMAFHKIVDVAAVRNRFMPATGAVCVFPVVRSAGMTRGAS